jgi:hypothetical protein
MTASECCPRLSGEGVKREDGQKYAAQGPSKIVALPVVHTLVTNSLNKRSFGSYVILLPLHARLGPLADIYDSIRS